LKRLERLDRVEAPPPESKTAALRLKQDVERAGATVVFAEGLSMGYDSLTLYEDVSFRVERGERVGIVGPNGSGKTTLLRHIAGRLEGGEGEVRFGHKVTPGFYQQHHEDLSRGNDIFTEVRAEQPEMTPEQVRTFLGRFLFTEDDAFKRIDTLSGGELSRVAIAKLILSGANLLLLDEPTNHLDIASREALEAALREFPGSILLVSHDRTLIDDLVSKVVVLEGGKAVVHLGNYTDYRQRRAERKAEEAEERRNEDALRIRDKSRPKKPKAAGTDEARRRQIKKDMGELESDIESVEEEIARLEAESVKIDPSDYVRAQEVKDEYEGMKSDLASMYAAWEELAAELDG
jgi:ATP-binding cassette subfamily F protein 3